MPPRQSDSDYKRPKITSQRFVPDIYDGCGRESTFRADRAAHGALKRSPGARDEAAHRSRHQGFAG